MYLLTSNPHKIKEYEEFGIEAKQGTEIIEVLGTIDEVIIYKTLSVSPFVLVEDTVLEVGGQAIVDAKYKLKQVPVNDDATWITSLGYHDDTNLYVYRGLIKGHIVLPVAEHESSFEPCFMPDGVEMTLYELKQKGLKQQFSARRLAIEAYRSHNPLFTKQIVNIPAWKGKYQVTNPNKK